MKHYHIILLLMILVATSCDNVSVSDNSKAIRPSQLYISLEKQLGPMNKISHYVFRSQEGFDPRTNIVISEPQNRNHIIRTIHASYPYKLWYASGYLLLDVHHQSGTKATLFINASDATHIEGDNKRYRCMGITQWLRRLYSLIKENGRDISNSTDKGLSP
jgi:hypothetical protein